MLKIITIHKQSETVLSPMYETLKCTSKYFCKPFSPRKCLCAQQQFQKKRNDNFPILLHKNLMKQYPRTQLLHILQTTCLQEAALYSSIL